MVRRTSLGAVQHTATHCNTHNATHCNTRTATHCNTHYPRRMARPHHLTHTNAACHMYKWIIADIQKCHVRSLNTRDTDRHRYTETPKYLHKWHPLHMQMNESESCHTCEWVMSHTCMSHHTHDWVIETYQQGRSQVRTWHVTHAHASSTHVARAFSWIHKEKERHMHVRHDTYTRASWHKHTCV